MKDHTHITQELRDIGLSEKAAAIYVAVLELGVAFPSKVSEKTKLNRTTVYHILTDLAVKGLITEIERKNKLCYQIERPERLVRFAKTQIRLAEERAERAQTILSDIEGLYNMVPNKPRVRFFEGLEGVLTVYEDHISGNESYEMLGYSNVEKLMQVLPPAFVKNYVKRKEEIGVTTRGIFPETTFSKNYNKEIYRGARKKALVQFHVVPVEQFPHEVEITIYGKDKVSIINFQKNTLIGVIIEDPTISQMMRMIFNLAWNGSEPSKFK